MLNIVDDIHIFCITLDIENARLMKKALRCGIFELLHMKIQAQEKDEEKFHKILKIFKLIAILKKSFSFCMSPMVFI